MVETTLEDQGNVLEKLSTRSHTHASAIQTNIATLGALEKVQLFHSGLIKSGAFALFGIMLSIIGFLLIAYVLPKSVP